MSRTSAFAKASAREVCGMMASRSGFTLMELSIVLVIIGLIIGGVMVGREMIKNFEIRAMLSQIEEYKTAATTFKLKYNQLPGDIGEASAAQFGFATRSSAAGYGDQDGNIMGENSLSATAINGEVVLFWNDLSAANLVNGTFTRTVSMAGGITTVNGSNGNWTGPFTPYFPAVKGAPNASMLVFNQSVTAVPVNARIPNYSGHIWMPTNIVISNNNGLTARTSATFPVSTAASIDTKIDDGMPETGKIVSAIPARASATTGSIGQASRITSVRGATEDFCVSNVSPFPYNMAFPDAITCNLMIGQPIF